MKLAILGATSGTGKLLVEQALAEGHEVVAFARNLSKLSTQHEHLTVVSGELTDETSVEQALSGADAVISALGPRSAAKGKPIMHGTRNILTAMEKHGVRRLVIASTPSASDPNDAPDFRFKMAIGFIRLMLRPAYEDIVYTAQIVRASDCDWTIVRVSMLTDEPKTGRVRVGYVNKAMGMRISRADLAEFMLEQVQDTKYYRQAPAISN